MTKSFIAIGSATVLLLLTLSGSAQSSVPQTSAIKEQMRQAEQALRQNRPDLAAQAYEAILKNYPDDVEARADLGIVAMVRGDWPRASAEMKKALALRPSDFKVQALLGLCDLHLGTVSEATELLSNSFPHLEDTKLRLEAGLRLVEIWYQEDELEKAEGVVNRLQQLYPSNAAVLYTAYRLHSALAFRALDALAIAAPAAPQLNVALAEHMVNEGNVQGAIAEYGKALESNPNLPSVHYELGEAFLRDSHQEPNLSKAQLEFERAIALNPSDARSECKLGEISLWRSNQATASEHYTRALKLSPAIPCANLGLAGLLMDDGNTQEALGYLQTATRSDPFNAQARYKLSVLYRRLGKKEDAERELAAFQELEKVQHQVQKALQQGPPSN